MKKLLTALAIGALLSPSALAIPFGGSVNFGSLISKRLMFRSEYYKPIFSKVYPSLESTYFFEKVDGANAYGFSFLLDSTYYHSLKDKKPCGAFLRGGIGAALFHLWDDFSSQTNFVGLGEVSVGYRYRFNDGYFLEGGLGAHIPIGNRDFNLATGLYYLKKVMPYLNVSVGF